MTDEHLRNVLLIGNDEFGLARHGRPTAFHRDFLSHLLKMSDNLLIAKIANESKRHD